MDKLKRELQKYLNAQTITSDNIGNIRRACFVPWDSKWNGIVRDETAKREQADDPTSVEGVNDGK